MNYRIEFTDDLMHVLDDENKGHDAHVVRKGGAAEAERKIDDWAREYGIDARRAKRELRELFRQM